MGLLELGEPCLLYTSIGGTDILDYTARALMDTVAFVFQDTYIIAESVYDNITMHREVSWEAVEQAAKAARCHEFILSLPDGYNTRLGDGGHKLSGGEAQRIAIARAILKDAPIVVLDLSLIHISPAAESPPSRGWLPGSGM